MAEVTDKKNILKEAIIKMYCFYPFASFEGSGEGLVVLFLVPVLLFLIDELRWNSFSTPISCLGLCLGLGRIFLFASNAFSFVFV